MSEKFLIKKALDVSPQALGKSFSSTIKGLLIILALAGIGYGLWKAYIRKPEASQSQITTIQKPENVAIDQRQILIETEKDTFFFGVRLWRVKLGISLLQKTKTQEQKGMIK